MRTRLENAKQKQFRIKFVKTLTLTNFSNSFRHELKRTAIDDSFNLNNVTCVG